MQPAERERLLEAMLSELDDRGYGAMRVDYALSEAGVSRADFEAEFGDRDACLFAAYAQLTERLARKTGEGCALGGEWPERVLLGLEALLEELTAAPAMARVAVQGFPAIGPEARARYQDFIEGFAPLLREGREFAEGGAELPNEVERLVIGAAEAIVFQEIVAGRAMQLGNLAPEILFLVLVPFLGREAASAEMRKAQERSKRGTGELPVEE
jgi:AcrR family transcriptional regulator